MFRIKHANICCAITLTISPPYGLICTLLWRTQYFYKRSKNATKRNNIYFYFFDWFLRLKRITPSIKIRWSQSFHKFAIMLLNQSRDLAIQYKKNASAKLFACFFFCFGFSSTKKYIYQLTIGSWASSMLSQFGHSMTVKNKRVNLEPRPTNENEAANNGKREKKRKTKRYCILCILTLLVPGLRTNRAINLHTLYNYDECCLFNNFLFIFFFIHLLQEWNDSLRADRPPFSYYKTNIMIIWWQNG